MSAMTRSPLLLGTVVGALALGACGGSNDDGGTTGGGGQGDKAFQGALKYAKCMRERGIDVPDPQRVGQGGIKMTMKGGPNTNTAKVQAAEKDCRKYMQIGGGRAPSPAEQAKVQNAMLDYAKCMRAHGVDMPDPKFSGGGGGATFQFGGPGGKGGATGPNPDSPAFKRADQACHGKLAAIERDGPGGGPSTQSSGDGAR
jgi:hypothetical protein